MPKKKKDKRLPGYSGETMKFPGKGKHAFETQSKSGRVFKEKKGEATMGTVRLKTPKGRDKKILKSIDDYMDKKKARKKPRKI